jgi:acetate kinase
MVMAADAGCRRVLTINGGSSSLKSAVYDVTGDRGQAVCTLAADGIGLSAARFRIRDGSGRTIVERDDRLPTLRAAMEPWLAWLTQADRGVPFEAAGHRIVHGGAHGHGPQRVTPELTAALRRLVPLDPDHLPGQLDAIETIAEACPGLPQVACFDTTFHRTLPDRARRYPLPRALADRGIVKYGFHGLSYEYILGALTEEAPATAAARIVIAHLGGGASMVAIDRGASVETTMGLTPAGGLMMGTRCGDLDPGVLVRLMQTERLSPEAVNDLVNHRAGLLGVSATSADMRQLLDRSADDTRAAEAVDMFCYIAKKWLGALLAVLGGVDVLVFTGGIGEHAPRVRAAICDGLAFAGIRLDPARNERDAAIVSADGAPVTVRVMATNEELMIARHTWAVMGARTWDEGS